MNLFLFGFTKTKTGPKPLLGRQNWVTSAGGRHSRDNLVPGLNTERRRDLTILFSK